MLCCVSRKSVGGSVISKKPPLIPPKEKLSNSLTVASSTIAKLYTSSSNFPSEKAVNLKTQPSDSILANEDETSELLPCAICSRTFKPQSLEKHVTICERTATKKRKPFDSAKQRIQGTELEEFLPKEQKKKILPEEKKYTSWKQNHDDFIKTIRAARGDSGDTTFCRQITSTVAPGAPTRANEKGLCPTCYRQFGIKAYDRHVAWCKERIARAPASPATNVAKERLDARMKYRAPLLKNRKMTNREKYAPHSGIKNNYLSNTKAKESLTSLNCSKVNESLSIKQPAVTERRKGEQGKTDAVIASGPVKSRLSDRITKNGDCHSFIVLKPINSSHIFPRVNYHSHDSSSKSSSQINPYVTVYSQSFPKNNKTKEIKRRESTKLQKSSFVTKTSICGAKAYDVISNDVIDIPLKPYGRWKNEFMDTKQMSNGQTNEKSVGRKISGLSDIEQSESTPQLDQTFLIKESTELSSIDEMSEYLSNDEYWEREVRNIEPVPGSSRTFNAEVSCASTSMASEEKIEENGHEEKRMKISPMEDMTEDELQNFFMEEVTNEAEERFDTPNYPMRASNVMQPSKKFMSYEEVVNESKKPERYSENDIQKSDNEIEVDDENIRDNNCEQHENGDIEKFGSPTESRNHMIESPNSVASSELLRKGKKLKKKIKAITRCRNPESVTSSFDSIYEPSNRRSEDYEVDAEQEIPPVYQPAPMNVNEPLYYPEIVIQNNGQYRNYQEQGAIPRAQMMENQRNHILYHLVQNPSLPHILPPIFPTNPRTTSRSSSQEFRPSWSTYVRRRPDFNLILTSRTGVCSDYDPFLMADRQLNELLSDTCSDQSFLDSPSTQFKPSSTPLYPHSHSSAFVKYPNSSPSNSPDKKGSPIAPPSEFDNISICFSSDSTDANSICRELFPDPESPCRREDQNKNKSNQPVLGRRVIIDKSKALGTPNTETFDDNSNRNNSNNNNNNNKNNNNFHKSRQVVEKVTTKCIKPQVARSNSVRAASAPKIPERNSVLSNKINSRSSPGSRLQNKSNNYANINGSNLSLSSIVSSEIEVKRSNSMFDDLVSSFEDESSSFPSLRSYHLKDDSLSLSSCLQANRACNGPINDEDLSSPEYYRRPENKPSADSAYGSLNNKYANYGHNVVDGANRIDMEMLRRREHEAMFVAKSKMSKFCHECGTKFPETAKFCCECGIQRLSLQ